MEYIFSKRRSFNKFTESLFSRAEFASSSNSFVHPFNYTIFLLNIFEQQTYAIKHIGHHARLR